MRGTDGYGAAEFITKPVDFDIPAPVAKWRKLKARWIGTAIGVPNPSALHRPNLRFRLAVRFEARTFAPSRSRDSDLARIAVRLDSKSPLSLLVCPDRSQKIDFAEGGPVYVREVEFAVRALP